MLETDSVEQTIHFYTSVLGFRVHQTYEHEGQLRWCGLQKDNTWLMFTARNAGKHPPALTGELHFYTTGIDEAWERLKSLAEVVRPLTDMPYNVREFTIRDNNGYGLTFGMELHASSDFDKYFPPELTLESSRVQLKVLRRQHIPLLQSISPSGTTWKYFTKDLNSEQGYTAWMEEALQDYGSQRRVPFVIFDKEKNEYAGSTSYGNISFFDRRLEIGWSWLGDAYKGTGVNTHAKFLLMQYAFETLGFERVEIKTDNLNERAKAALVKVGARPEGVLYNHMQMHSNRRRDSIYFAVLKNEWPAVKKEKFKDLVVG